MSVVQSVTLHSRVKPLAKPIARTKITNGRRLLAGKVDGRSLWARRFRDVLALHMSDLGGEANTSEAEKAIARRAACLICELEQIEVKFANGDVAETERTTGHLLDRYQRGANTLRRLLESLGFERRAKVINADTHANNVEELLSYFRADDNEA
jgi:hypothetical protein